jgi:ADP-ribose pyrophosphatase YjhB (NUDIX family)
VTEDDEPPRVTRVGAYAVCVDEAGRLLLCRVAPGHWVGRDGWWMLPGGGLEHGEDPRDGALRELAEETGLVGEIEGLLEVASWHELYTNVAGDLEDHHGIRVLYRCRITGGELRDEVEGSTDACRWFAPSELPTDRMVDIAALAARLVL